MISFTSMKNSGQKMALNPVCIGTLRRARRGGIDRLPAVGRDTIISLDSSSPWPRSPVTSMGVKSIGRATVCCSHSCPFAPLVPLNLSSRTISFKLRIPSSLVYLPDFRWKPALGVPVLFSLHSHLHLRKVDLKMLQVGSRFYLLRHAPPCCRHMEVFLPQAKHPPTPLRPHFHIAASWRTLQGAAKVTCGSS